jgi:hypothetical protein
MKEIIIKTQKELDALPDGYKNYQEIYINSDPNIWLQISKTPQNAKIVLRESSHAELRESSHAVLRESSHAVLWESSHAELWGSSHAVLWGSSHAVLRGSSHAVLRESSHAVLRESSHAVLWGSSHAELWGSSHAVLRESSHAVLRESSHAVLRGNSSAKSQDKTVVIDKLLEQATLICIDKKCAVREKEATANIIISPPVTYNIKSFCDIYSNNMESKKEIILYKSVRPDNDKDFYTNSIKYDGVVECPDFDPDTERQCGGGLHLSPTPELALSYNQGKVLKCSVNVKDIVVYGLDITKVRCRKVTVLGEYKNA